MMKTVRFPGYFKDFVCTGSACEDTCCASWDISADKKALERYGKVTGEFGKRLKQSVNRKTGAFIQKKGRCPFLNEKNLCDIYSEIGKENLCRTCKNYPRHAEVYGKLYEVSLSLSCPEAARLILDGQREADFYVRNRNSKSSGKSEISGACYGTGSAGVSTDDEVDERLLTELLSFRSAMFALLKRRELSIELRMSMILAMGHDGQRYIAKKDFAALEGIGSRYLASGAAERFAGLLKPYERQREKGRDLLCRYVELCGGLEEIVPDWRKKIEQLADILYGSKTETEEYAGCRDALKDGYEDYEADLERLMTYFLYVYVPGGVYDGDLYGTVKFAVFSCLMIREIAIGIQMKSGTFEKKDAVRISYLYARELEHCDENLEETEEWLESSGLFSLKTLLLCINS